MKLEIGLITSESHLTNLKIVVEKLSGLCNTHFFVAHENEDITTHFLNEFSSVDAFIFSGPTLYQYLLNHVPPFEKPCYVIYDDLAHIYREILTLFMQDRTLNGNRVYIDFFTKDNYKTYEGIFPPEATPYFSPWTSDETYESGQLVLERHLELWNQRKIDLSITKYGLLVDEFKKAGIKYYFITPSIEYLTDFFHSALNDLKLKILRNNRVSITLIRPAESLKSPADPVEKDIRLLSLERELLTLIREDNYDFILHKENGRLAIISTIEETSRLTSQFKICGIKRALCSTIDFDFAVGYGSGKNHMQAKKNASEALRKSRSSENLSYFVGVDHALSGPLDGGSEKDPFPVSDPFIENLAGRIGISSMYLNKIVTYTKKISSNKITSQDLANILLVASRSGNRILNQMVENKFALATHEKKSADKGRPSKQYELLFLESNGQLSLNSMK